MTPKQQADFEFAVSLHEQAKMMGLDDAEIIAIAETDGDIDAVSMQAYKEKYSHDTNK